MGKGGKRQYAYGVIQFYLQSAGHRPREDERPRCRQILDGNYRYVYYFRLPSCRAPNLTFLSLEHSWLLIFDNVEEATIDALEALRPTKSTKRSAIILTSQLEQHKHRVQSSLALKSLSDEDSVELLLKCLHRDRSEVTEEDQKLLDEVSKMLGGLPLAIVHIGGYISESRHGLSYFRDFFKSRWQHYAWGGKSVAEQYHKRLEIVWDLALDELPPNARKLIDIMAYLNPDVIPEDWLAEEIARNPNDWDFPRHMNIAEYATDHLCWGDSF